MEETQSAITTTNSSSTQDNPNNNENVEENLESAEDNFITNKSAPVGDLSCKLFSGRFDILVKLHTILTKEEEEDDKNGQEDDDQICVQRLIVLTGIRGIGKTELVKKYILNHHDNYDKVVWINSEKIETITNSFLSVARQLMICYNFYNIVESSVNLSDVGYLISEVYRHFSLHFRKSLFVFDNVNQIENSFDDFGILDFLPQEPLDNFPYILITSRNEGDNHHGLGFQSILLEPLKEGETQEFLRKALMLKNDDHHQESITKLCQLLAGYPLALNLAASTILEEWKKDTNSSEGHHDDDPNIKKKIEDYVTDFETSVEKLRIHKDTAATAGDDNNKVDYEDDDHRHNKYDQILMTVWQVMVNKIKSQVKKEEEEGTENEHTKMIKIAINLLNLIVHMPNDCVCVEFCHFFHSSTKLTHNILRHFKIQDAKDVQEALNFLQKYSIISVQQSSIQDQMTFNTFMPSWEVKVDPLLQEWAKFMQKEEEDNDENNCWLKLVNYIEQNYNFLNFSAFWDSIHDHVMRSKWPPGIYRNYLFIALNLRESRTEATSMLKTIYKFFVNDQSTTTTTTTVDHEEYLNLCKMALIYSHHECVFANFESDVFSDRIDHYNVSGEEAVLDNSSLLDSSDAMYKISFPNFIDWTLDQAITYIDNQLVQKITADILLSSYRRILDDCLQDSEDEPQMEKKRALLTKLREWITKYNNTIQSSNATKSLTYNSWRTSASVFLLATKDSQTLTPELTLILVKTIEAQMDNMDEFNCWEYLYETTRFWDAWITRAWENSSSDSDNMKENNYLSGEVSGAKRLFLESGGLHLLIKGLDWIPTHSVEDIKYTVMHFLDMIRDMAFFEDCRTIMLTCPEFTEAFSKVFNSILTFTGDVSESHMKIIVSVLLSWFALQVDDEKKSNSVFPTQLPLVAESMGKFNTKFVISHNDNNDDDDGGMENIGCSPQLYHALRHCSGSRKILEKFLQSHTDESSAGTSYVLAHGLSTMLFLR